MTTPIIGEIRKAQDIGKKSTNHYIWSTCEECGKEKWRQLDHGKPRNKLCYSCSSKKKIIPLGEKNRNWRGGRCYTRQGYIMVKISRDNFFYAMATKEGYVLEHRLVMGKHLGRNLHNWEIVHHKNHKKDDNQPENLEILSDIGHKTIGLFDKKIEYLLKQNQELKEMIGQLRKEIRLIRWENKQKKEILQ